MTDPRTPRFPPEPPRGKPGHRSALIRILTALVAIPVFVLVTLAGGWPFLLAVEAIVVLGALEFFGILGPERFGILRPAGVLGAASLPPLLALAGAGAVAPHLAATAILILAIQVHRSAAGRGPEEAGLAILAVLYVGWLASHLLLLRGISGTPGEVGSRGASAVLLAAALTWSHDTGAYAVGIRLGRHALLPRVSPAKTWEGAAGGLVCCLAGVLVARAWFAAFLSLPEAVGLAVGGTAAAVVGDLAESALKRSAKVKDTGRFFPGHGGILDRFDSFLFTAPFVYYGLRILGH
jgi:phosphatidate cytidylyltransferase